MGTAPQPDLLRRVSLRREERGGELVVGGDADLVDGDQRHLRDAAAQRAQKEREPRAVGLREEQRGGVSRHRVEQSEVLVEEGVSSPLGVLVVVVGEGGEDAVGEGS